MRAFQLVRLAIESELLRLRHLARRSVSRIVLGCCAAILVLVAFGFGHVAAWYWLRLYMAGQYAGLIFAGTDLLLAAILATVAARSTPGPVELEALNLRKRALDDAASSLSISALLVRAVDFVISSRRRP